MPSSRINDRDVRHALQTLEDEIENYEANISELEDALGEEQNKVENLKEEVEELEKKVKELEEALAEAYLTSEVEDEQHQV